MATMETGLANGVSFALTDEQKELRALAREFAAKEIRPKAAEYDEHQTHPADVVAKAHELGLMNLHLPESLGGPELSAFDGMLVGEELSWRRFSRSRSSAASASPSRGPAPTCRGSRRPRCGKAMNMSSTARRCSSRTRAARRGWSVSPPRTSPRATAG